MLFHSIKTNATVLQFLLCFDSFISKKHIMVLQYVVGVQQCYCGQVVGTGAGAGMMANFSEHCVATFSCKYNWQYMSLTVTLMLSR